MNEWFYWIFWILLNEYFFEWIFWILFWIEFWIESFLGQIQWQNEFSIRIAKGYSQLLIIRSRALVTQFRSCDMIDGCRNPIFESVKVLWCLRLMQSLKQNIGLSIQGRKILHSMYPISNSLFEIICDKF